MAYLAILLFVIGIVLLIVEAFIPGFGVPGISGITAIVIGIVLVSHSVAQAFLILLITAVLLTIAFSILIRWMMKKQLYSKIVLQDKVPFDKPEYNDMEFFMNKEGKTVTALRPVGNVDFNGVKLEAVSNHGFIQDGVKVVVVDIQGSKIIVEPLEQ